MVNDASACSRSNLIDRSKGRTKVRGPYVKAEDKQLLPLNGALLMNGRPTATAESEGVVVGACNHPHKLDAALVRAGRLERHVRIQRAQGGILRWHLQSELTNEDLSGIAGERRAGAARPSNNSFVKTAARRVGNIGNLASATLPPSFPSRCQSRKRCEGGWPLTKWGMPFCASRSVPESLFH